MTRRFSRTTCRAFVALFTIAVVSSACVDLPEERITNPEPGAAAVPGQDAGLQRALAAQNRHTRALMEREGIVGTGVGVDEAGRYMIRLYVVAPGLANLPVALDEVPVEPVVTGLIMAGDVNDPTSKERPAPNGFSIGHPQITAGTMSAIVKNGAGDRFILSNNHVLANSNDASVGDASLQPGPADGGTSADQIATLSDFVNIDFSGGDNTVDAAISAVAGADVTAATPSPPVGYGAPGTTTVSAVVGQNVQKFGRTTGHTTGQVAEINATVNVCYETRGPFRCVKLARFVNQFTISPGSFSDPGDSGSLIVTDDADKNPVGLLFAGSDTRTIANPIDDVLDAFNVMITDDPGSGGGGDPPENSPPTASFTYSCTDLSCDFDGSGSSDSDGSIDSYDWDFGDGSSPGSGMTVSHTYGADGTWTVTLTVTDDGGDTGSDSQNVTVSSSGGGGDGISLSVQGYKFRGLHKADLTWDGATSTNVDVWRDGSIVATPENLGSYTDNIDNRGGGSYTYQVCEEGTDTCSNEATITF